MIRFFGIIATFGVVLATCSSQEQVTKDIDRTEENRYTKVILSYDLNEPTEFVILPDKRIIVVERKGDIKLYDPEKTGLEIIAHIDVYTEQEDGLMGIALDPNFQYNKWLYLYYSPEGPEEKQNLSRFTFKAGKIDLESEIVMLEVKTQRQECCHTGGSIQFGPDGLMYLSTGDDTNPFGSDGFSPADEGRGRSPWDAQKSSGNTNDLRGKILRIKPEADGSYSIPEGNLFPAGTPNARPEIYVMGNRNPYRISIDQKRNWLFWGEVGPDAPNDKDNRGPRGHDEINVAKEAGFFGWPYFVGDNKAYIEYDFASGRSFEAFDPKFPINNSPNNTGLDTLPPAQPALIWYPYAESEEFPMLGKGGRNAMAGPVYYSDLVEKELGSFPSEFNGKLFIYDWIRGWIFTVTLTEDGSLVGLEPFMPKTQFNYMIDMEMGPEGALYILEYGTGWFTKNNDAAIVRIDYNGGNRKPTLNANASTVAGSAPLEVKFDTEGTFDYDNDNLTYLWEINNNRLSEPNVSYTFERPGIYYPKITVMDVAGNKISQQFKIAVGNAKPDVKVELTGNSTFYWPGDKLEYTVVVKDEEDGIVGNGINEEDVSFKIEYISEGLDLTQAAQTTGHQVVSKGLSLISESDCQSCHKLNEKSIGPSYTDVALRYKSTDANIEMLSNKVINGGAGNWGEQAMAAHPSLPKKDAEEMIKYILSVADQKEIETFELADEYRFNGSPLTKEGVYVFNASYEDKGANGMAAIEDVDRVILRNPYLQAEDFDEQRNTKIYDMRGNQKHIYNVYHDSYVKFTGVDLTDIKSLTFLFLINETRRASGTMELRLDGVDGKVAGSVSFEQSTPVMKLDETGKHDLYFVYQYPDDPKQELYSLDWIYFSKQEQPGRLNY